MTTRSAWRSGSLPHSRTLQSTRIKQLQFVSLFGHYVRVGVHALKIYPGINRKCRVLYPGTGFLFSATWPLMLKKHYNGFVNQSWALRRFKQ